MVLVHGLSKSTHLWYKNLPELAERYRVYLLDLPGFGAMRKFRSHFNLKQSEAWLGNWMRAMDLETVYLVGHSMGGYASMALAATSPEKVPRIDEKREKRDGTTTRSPATKTD